MDGFISTAYAASDAALAQQGGLMSMMPMLIIFFGMMYFMIIRPQQKRAKDHQSMLDGLAPGDEIATAGGIVGKLIAFKDDFAVIEIADNTQLTLQKTSIASVFPKGTIS